MCKICAQKRDSGYVISSIGGWKMKLILYIFVLMVMMIGYAAVEAQAPPVLNAPDEQYEEEQFEIGDLVTARTENSGAPLDNDAHCFVDSLSDYSGARTTAEIYLSLAALVFALIFGVLIIVVVIRNGKWDANSFQLFGLALVLGMGAFLIPAGYSQEQIAPLTGLLGVIVGYLLKKGPD
jgi:hypothetical protein